MEPGDEIIVWMAPDPVSERRCVRVIQDDVTILTIDCATGNIVTSDDQQPLPEWCPVCHTYHRDPGSKTDAGKLVRRCGHLSPDDPLNQFEFFPGRDA